MISVINFIQTTTIVIHWRPTPKHEPISPLTPSNPALNPRHPRLLHSIKTAGPKICTFLSALTASKASRQINAYCTYHYSLHFYCRYTLVLLSSLFFSSYSLYHFCLLYILCLQLVLLPFAISMALLPTYRNLLASQSLTSVAMSWELLLDTTSLILHATFITCFYALIFYFNFSTLPSASTNSSSIMYKCWLSNIPREASGA